MLKQILYSGFLILFLTFQAHALDPIQTVKSISVSTFSDCSSAPCEISAAEHCRRELLKEAILVNERDLAIHVGGMCGPYIETPISDQFSERDGMLCVEIKVHAGISSSPSVVCLDRSAMRVGASTDNTNEVTCSVEAGAALEALY